jgi:hypothetical protein
MERPTLRNVQTPAAALARRVQARARVGLPAARMDAPAEGFAANLARVDDSPPKRSGTISMWRPWI